MGFIVLIWLAFSIFVGIRAKARGRSAMAWFFISIFLTPVLAVLALFLLPELNNPGFERVAPQAPKGDHVECLKCGELIATDAEVCPYCGFEVLPSSEESSQGHRTDAASLAQGNSNTAPSNRR